MEALWARDLAAGGEFSGGIERRGSGGADGGNYERKTLSEPADEHEDEDAGRPAAAETARRMSVARPGAVVAGIAGGGEGLPARTDSARPAAPSPARMAG